MKTPITRVSQIKHLGLDIETVPDRELHEYEPTVRVYIERKLARAKASDPTMTYDKFASLHPNFGRVVCFSIGYMGENANGEPAMALKTYAGSEPELLEAFVRVAGPFRGVWVHYNGRAFDVPFLVSRLRHHRILGVSPHFADLCRPNGHGHIDMLEYHSLGEALRRLPLGVLASLEGLPSPKSDLDGSKIADAFRQGEIARIGRYCEWDVATVLNLQRMLVDGLEPVRSENLFSVDCDGEYRQLAAARDDGSCPSAWYEDNRLYLPTVVERNVTPAQPGPGVLLCEDGKITKDDLQAMSDRENCKAS